eukprot:636079-Rhodomonas_salina.1
MRVCVCPCAVALYVPIACVRCNNAFACLQQERETERVCARRQRGPSDASGCGGEQACTSYGFRVGEISAVKGSDGIYYWNQMWMAVTSYCPLPTPRPSDPCSTPPDIQGRACVWD